MIIVKEKRYLTLSHRWKIDISQIRWQNMKFPPTSLWFFFF